MEGAGCWLYILSCSQQACVNTSALLGVASLFVQSSCSRAALRCCSLPFFVDFPFFVDLRVFLPFPFLFFRSDTLALRCTNLHRHAAAAAVLVTSACSVFTSGWSLRHCST